MMIGEWLRGRGSSVGSDYFLCHFAEMTLPLISSKSK